MTARVGVNLAWLVPGVVGGSEVSTVTTLEALAGSPPDDLEHVLYVLAPFADAHPELVQRFETHVLPLSGALKGLRVAAEQTWLVDRARRDRLAAIHQMGGTAMLVGGPPTALSIHDLQPFDIPEHFHPVKRAWLRVALPRSVRRSRVVLTPSEWVRRTVIDRFGADPDVVVNVPHGLPALDVGTGEEELRRRLDLRGDVVLYPTITYAHKDHVTLVRAFADVARAHDGPDATLVLTGGEGPAEDAVRSAIAESGVADRIRRTGSLPRADVVGLIDMAAIVAVPSRYEGFGIPALEAMARGRAVVAADATALPEVVDDGGVLVPPGDVAAWAATLSALLVDPDRRAALGDAGRRRSRRFSAAANLEGTLRAQRRALGSGSSPPT